MSRKKAGNDAINQVCDTINRELRKTPEGRELLNNDSHVGQRLAYFVCRDLGIICKYIYPGFGEDWMLGCKEKPRGRGLCLNHYRKKFMRYVFDNSGKKVQKYLINTEKTEKTEKKKIKITKKN